MGLSISPEARKARTELLQQSEALTALDFKPTSYARIQHEDGSHFMIASAFIREWEEWIFVFCEHMEPLYFAKEDLLFWEDLSARYWDKEPAVEDEP